VIKPGPGNALTPRFPRKGKRRLLRSVGRVLDQSTTTSRSVLFGTDSFWTGVNVPGEALSNVIITRLPFAVPGHPLIEAKLEFAQERGGDPFTEYSLPEAISKLC